MFNQLAIGAIRKCLKDQMIAAQKIRCRSLIKELDVPEKEEVRTETGTNKISDCPQGFKCCMKIPNNIIALSPSGHVIAGSAAKS